MTSLFLPTLFVLLLESQPTALQRTGVYSNHWAVRIAGGPGVADHLAAQYGYTNLGQVRHTLVVLQDVILLLQSCVVLCRP